MRFLLLCSIVFLASAVSAAERLSPANAALSPQILGDPANATIARDIDVTGDGVNASYVVASVPGLGLFQRTAAGAFTAWDGNLASLQDNRFSPIGDVLHYAIFSGSLSGIPLPLTVYVGYRDQDGVLKYGHFSVRTSNSPPTAGGCRCRRRSRSPTWS